MERAREREKVFGSLLNAIRTHSPAEEKGRVYVKGHNQCVDSPFFRDGGGVNVASFIHNAKGKLKSFFH